MDSAELAADYYVHGFRVGRFKDSSSLARLNDAISKLQSKELKAGFHWDTKYPKSRDLKPGVIDYDSIFMDVLFENGVPEFIKACTGYDLVLAHVQLRIAEKGNSYMDWHRDVYSYGSWVGRVPPTHKIIFYPTGNRAPEPKLFVLPGSHRSMPTNKWLDLLQAKVKKKFTLQSSDSDFILFDTSLLHAAAAEVAEQGSVRVIYSFCHAQHLKDYASSRAIHEAYLAGLERQARDSGKTTQRESGTELTHFT